MKLQYWVLAVLTASTLAFAGCSKSGSVTVNTQPLETSFQAAEPATQSSAQKVVSAVKSGDYSTALAELKSLAQNAKLTPEQQQAIKDVMAQVQQALAGAATKAADEAGKAMENVKQALPK